MTTTYKLRPEAADAVREMFRAEGVPNTVDNASSWSRSVTTTKSHFCRFDADGERQPASRIRSTSASPIA